MRHLGGAMLLGATLALGLACGTGVTIYERLTGCFIEDTGFYYNPPTIVDDAIYIGTSVGQHSEPTDGAFYKLTTDLEKVWSYSLGTDIVRGAASLDSAGNSYFVVQTDPKTGDYSDSSFQLYSLSPSGKLRWKKTILPVGDFVPNVGMNSPAVAADDTIYAGGSVMYAFDSDGNQQWTADPVGGGALSMVNSPIIDSSGNLYFVAQGKLHSLSSAGAVRWTFDPGISGASGLSSPAFNNAQTHVVFAIATTVYLIATADGSEAWSYEIPGAGGEIRGTPAVSSTGEIYVGTKDDDDSVFYAIKSDGSGLLWKNAIGADLYSSPALGEGGIIYVGSEMVSGAHTLHALAMTTGEIEYSIGAGVSNWGGSPALLDDGSLYTATRSGLCRIETDSSGLIGGGSPKFRATNENHGRQ